jgi:hypothetical protein
MVTTQEKSGINQLLMQIMQSYFIRIDLERLNIDRRFKN